MPNFRIPTLDAFDDFTAGKLTWEQACARMPQLVHVTPDLSDYAECPDCKGDMQPIGHTDHYNSPCIHPGVFATDQPTSYCPRCDRDIPRQEL